MCLCEERGIDAIKRNLENIRGIKNESNESRDLPRTLLLHNVTTGQFSSARGATALASGDRSCSSLAGTITGDRLKATIHSNWVTGTSIHRLTQLLKMDSAFHVYNTFRCDGVRFSAPKQRGVYDL